MKFCDIKTAERQGKPAKAGLYGPRRAGLPPSIRPFSCHPFGRGEKAARTASKTLTVVFTTLYGLFIAGAAFSQHAEFMRFMSTGPSPEFDAIGGKRRAWPGYFWPYSVLMVGAGDLRHV